MLSKLLLSVSKEWRNMLHGRHLEALSTRQCVVHYKGVWIPSSPGCTFHILLLSFYLPPRRRPGINILKRPRPSVCLSVTFRFRTVITRNSKTHCCISQNFAGTMSWGVLYSFRYWLHAVWKYWLCVHYYLFFIYFIKPPQCGEEQYMNV